MRTRVAGGLLAATIAVLAMTACSDDDDLYVDLDPPTTSEVPGGEVGTIGTFDDALDDGIHFGYLRSLLAGHNEIVGIFDPAELLTGDAAVAAAGEAGDEPMDYFIRNEDDSEQFAISVDPEAEVLDIPYGTDACCEPRASTPAQFADDPSQGAAEPRTVELTVTDGTVTRIEEIYLP